jgi:hypothetical protein
MKEGAAYPEYIGVSEVTTRSFEHMRVEAHFDGQPSLMFDEPEGFDIGDPPELRGRSRGWTPVHAQLAALAGCTSITIAVVARDQQFACRGLRTKMRLPGRRTAAARNSACSAWRRFRCWSRGWVNCRSCRRGWDHPGGPAAGSSRSSRPSSGSGR